MKIVKQPGNDYGFPFIVYMPEHLSEHPAIIIELHGAGERGEGGDELEKVLIHGFPNIANDQNLKDCILIMPQCPKNSFWAARIESLKRFIDKVAEEYSADKDRIYLCGLSMGGFGTWYTAMAYPDMFAAIAPCCGGGMPWNAHVLNMPIWAFHGLEDTVVDPINTIHMIERIKERPNVRCDLYEGVGHDSWDRAFSEELLEWMLAQRR